jgi:integrase
MDTAHTSSSWRVAIAHQQAKSAQLTRKKPIQPALLQAPHLAHHGIVTVLRKVRQDQLERRLLPGSDWHGTDLVVEHGDGSPVHPDLFSTRFARLAKKVGLADVRLHDLRHAYASQLLRANVHPKIVSDQLGMRR